MRTNTAIGALIVVGLALPAMAQVSGVSVAFEVDLPDIVDVNTGDSLGNESFLDQGGLELLPYSRSGEGGFNDIVASASLTAELSAAGAFAGAGSNSATDPYIEPSDAFSRTTIDFTVSGSMSYEFAYNGFFDNDGGWYSASLTGPGGTVFASSPLFPGDNDETFSGVLAAGEYQLVTYGSSRGNVSYSFSIVPAPMSGALLGFAGAFAARRRR